MARKTPIAPFHRSTFRHAVVAALAVSQLLFSVAMAMDERLPQYPAPYRPAGGVQVLPTAQFDEGGYAPQLRRQPPANDDGFTTVDVHPIPSEPEGGERSQRPPLVRVQNTDIPDDEFRPVDGSGDEFEQPPQRFDGGEYGDIGGAASSTAPCGVKTAGTNGPPYPPLPPLEWFMDSIRDGAAKIKAKRRGIVSFQRGISVPEMYGGSLQRQPRPVLGGDMEKNSCTKTELVEAMAAEYQRWAMEKGMELQPNDKAMEAMKLMAASAVDHQLSGRARRMWTAFKKLRGMRFCCKKRKDGIYNYLYAIKDMYKGDRRKACSLLQHSEGVRQYIDKVEAGEGDAEKEAEGETTF